jgi:MFS family permease
MSGIISAPQFFRVFPDLNPDNVGHTAASTMQALYTAIYEVGCLFGALFALLFGNKVGRRRNMYIGVQALGSLLRVPV